MVKNYEDGIDSAGFLEEMGESGEGMSAGDELDVFDDMPEVLQGSVENLTDEGEFVETTIDGEEGSEEFYPIAVHRKQKPDTKIFNKSAIYRLDPLARWVYEQIEKESQEKLFEDADIRVPLSDDEIALPRALQGLAELCERYRSNMYEAIDQEFEEKRKRNRIRQKKILDFRGTGHRQLARAIRDHIDALIGQGKFSRLLFAKYNDYYKQCIESKGDDALYAGLNLVLCAEVIVPAVERVNPVKRITSSLPTGV